MKYCCFFCLWESQATDNTMLLRTGQFVPGKSNVEYVISATTVGNGSSTTKSSVKVSDKNGNGFNYTKQKISKTK